jgi:hypothetical protein
MIAAIFATLMMMQSLDDTGTAVAQPIGRAQLEPVSGSYFQVFEFYGRPPHTWKHATRMVKGYHHEGREGRLALIKDGTTHYFLLLNFEMLRTYKMWIGLSAVCNKQADLVWLDDTPLSETSFRAWSRVAQKGIRDRCKRLEGSGTALPIYYDPSIYGVRWEVADPQQNVIHMMVEFPVPAAIEAEKEASETPAEITDEITGETTGR